MRKLSKLDVSVAYARGSIAGVDRYGLVVLFFVFLALLGGRFTLDRVGDFAAWDLRWPGLVIVSALIFVWLAASREPRQRRIKAGAGLQFFIAWAAWMVISAAWAPPRARVDGQIADLVLMVAFVVLAVSVSGCLSRQALRAVWWWIVIAGLVYFAAAVYAGPGDQGRYSALGGGPNVFVRIMILACLGAFFLATVRRSNWILVTVPVFLFGAVLSGSRGGIIALLVVIVLGGVPLFRRMSRAGRRTTVSVMLAAILAVPIFGGLRSVDTSMMHDRFVVQTVQEQYDSSRVNIAETAIDLFEKNPILGAGLDGYFATARGAFEYPHNVLLATAAEGGIIGLALLILALGQFLRTIWACRPLSTEALYALLAGIYILVASLFSGDYYDSRLLWFFLVLAAIEARRESAVEACPAKFDRRIR